jgi:hypothetical protein
MRNLGHKGEHSIKMDEPATKTYLLVKTTKKQEAEIVQQDNPSNRT